MYAEDFEYDGRYLSDYGFVICDIGGDMEIETVSAGGTVTMQTVRHGIGRRAVAVNAVYESCIEADFTIAKNPCVYEDMEITDDEQRDMMRWLNRRSYRKMRLLKSPQNDDDGCYYNAVFNIDKIRSHGRTIGLTLHMTTDSPFGHGTTVFVNGTNCKDEDGSLIAVANVNDENDDIGYVYPNMILYIMSMHVEDGVQDREKISMWNERFPDEIFEINNTGFADVMAKKYTVNGTSLTISQTDIEAELTAHNSDGSTLDTVTSFITPDAYTPKKVVYDITDGFEPGTYRFVVGGPADNKRFIALKVNEDGTLKTIRDNLTYTYSTSAKFGIIGGTMIIFNSESPLNVGSYIEMKITYADCVVGDTFNYTYIRIGNTHEDRTNLIKSDLPCVVSFSYDPIIKLTP